jgi:hypothetical protein
MEYATHNEKNIDVNKTFVQGHVNMNYFVLIDVLGSPIAIEDPYSVIGEGTDHKVDWEWNIEFEDGTVATIYNWKNGPGYGGEATHGGQIRRWHVGGHSQRALENVQALFNK